MQIRDMFQKDIDRTINGVVKVAQEADGNIRQELEEYVITRELHRHFDQFFENYGRGLDVPSDAIGVWISGFFGSGKSHFLKMLSYLLSNRVVDGRPAIEYFEPKFAYDPLVAASARRCASVPTESILFNIDNKGPANKDKTAILRTFATVFYEHLGYYGRDLRLVRLEQAIDSKGRRNEFRRAYEGLAGRSWIEDRESYDLFQDDVIDALAQAGVMSTEAATRWFDGTETAEFSIDALVEDVRAYVDAKASQTPGGMFRLLFMVDEVGQYIGGDVNLMLNLQTLVEELGSRCSGRVWVMVTSQEAIDEITAGQVDNDFSKIQGRFATRLSLSSSSVDEVIKARILEKTPEAAELLQAVYAEQSAVLKNLFSFEGARGDLLSYTGAQDFCASFPFVNYQFHLAQDAFSQIRQHGSSGKHLSSGERSMLSGFQEAAQAVEERDEYALVPFWRFYGTMEQFLEGYIRRTIDRCALAAQSGDQGLEPMDADVLKLLFLVRYVDYVPATLNNVAILMADDIRTDPIRLRQQVKDSLARLERQNYISRSGDVYSFLTDEEQDIAREVAAVPVEVGAVVHEIAATVYGDIYTSEKFAWGSNNFVVDRYVDEALYGKRSNGMTLRVVTAASELHGAGAQGLALKSGEPQALVVLEGNDDYFQLLQHALKIERYLKAKSPTQLPEKTQAILRLKREEARVARRDAKALLEEALAKASIYVAGREVSVPACTPRQRVEHALNQLVEAVYTKLDYIQTSVSTDGELRAILLGGADALGGDDPNFKGNDAVQNYLDTLQRAHQEVTMEGLQRAFRQAPYGWREFDVAATVARLVRAQRATVSVDGVALKANDPSLPGLLHNRTDIARTVVAARVGVDPKVLGSARSLLRELADTQNVPSDEDSLVDAVKAYLDSTAARMGSLLQKEYGRADYPGKATVEKSRRRYGSLASSFGDAAVFLGEFVAHEDELLDLVDELRDVERFFNSGQRERFDEALSLRTHMAAEASYLEGSPEAVTALAALDEVLSMESPYGRIKDLAGLMGQVKTAHAALLSERRRAVLDDLAAMEQAVEAYATGKRDTEAATSHAKERVTVLRQQANDAKTCEALDAMKARIDQERSDAYTRIDEAADAAEARERDRMRLEQEKERQARGGMPEDARVRVTRVTPQPVATAGAQGVGSIFTPATAPAPKPKDVRRLSRATVCPPERLMSEADIDAYIERLSRRLKEELAGHDGIRLV